MDVKDNDLLLVAFNIIEMMHKIQESSMKSNLPFATFVKSLYPTHSNYLESLQASNKFKHLSFDTMVEKIADREKAFRKNTSDPLGDYIFFAQEEKN